MGHRSGPAGDEVGHGAAREGRDGNSDTLVIPLTGAAQGFNLLATIHSGQAFRWEEIPGQALPPGLPTAGADLAYSEEPEPGTTIGVAGVVGPHAVRVWQPDPLHLQIQALNSPAQSESFWRRYFDLDTDYEAIAEELARREPRLLSAIETFAGLRILRQPPWEALLAFILSTNNNIPRIASLLRTLAQRFGRPVAPGLHRLPEPAELDELTLEDLRSCGVGYRAPYLKEAARRVASGELDLEALREGPVEEARQALTALPGVGRKVADCVLLFSLDRFEVFPIDVWAKRALEHLFFGGQKQPLRRLHAFAQERFGELAGYAQNFLFSYIRSLRAPDAQRRRST